MASAVLRCAHGELGVKGNIDAMNFLLDNFKLPAMASREPDLSYREIGYESTTLQLEHLERPFNCIAIVVCAFGI